MNAQTLVLVPARNEIATLPGLVEQVRGLGHDVLVLDGNSTDGSREWMMARGVHFLTDWFRGNLGHSFWRGFSMAQRHGYERVATMDAGGSHDPASLLVMLDRINEADVVLGSRFMRGGDVQEHPWYRIWLSRAATSLFRSLSGLGVPDATSGYRVYGPRAIALLVQTRPLSCSGFAWHLEALWRCRYLTIVASPIIYRGGESSANLDKILECLILLWRLRSCD